MISNIGTVDNVESLNQISNIKLVASFLESYKVKLQGLKGELGVTAQFWIKYILIWSNSLSVPICNQYKQFFSQTDGLGKNFTILLCNKAPYACYGTYYNMQQLEKSHPGSLDEIRSFMQ